MTKLPVKLILYAVLTVVSVWLCFGHWDQIRERVLARVPHESSAPAVKGPAPDPVDIPDAKAPEPEPTYRILGNVDEARESMARTSEKRLQQEEEARKAARRHARHPSTATPPAPSSGLSRPSPAPSN